MRVFFDTNVLVSAFATRGLCTDVLRHVLAKHVLIVGEVVIEELKRVLHDRFRLKAPAIEEIEALLRGFEVVPTPARPADVKIRDPQDAWILASAMDGNADVVVTGDADLLTLGKNSPIPVMSPREFWRSATEA